MKLGNWRQFPWCWFGLAHHNPDVARAVGRDALQVWHSREAAAAAAAAAATEPEAETPEAPLPLAVAVA
eukprot:322540-Alexandrium_andersonii.AAC.1